MSFETPNGIHHRFYLKDIATTGRDVVLRQPLSVDDNTRSMIRGYRQIVPEDYLEDVRDVDAVIWYTLATYLLHAHEYAVQGILVDAFVPKATEGQDKAPIAWRLYFDLEGDEPPFLTIDVKPYGEPVAEPDFAYLRAESPLGKDCEELLLSYPAQTSRRIRGRCGATFHVLLASMLHTAGWHTVHVTTPKDTAEHYALYDFDNGRQSVRVALYGPRLDEAIRSIDETFGLQEEDFNPLPDEEATPESED